jgi:hypothetical protein
MIKKNYLFGILLGVAIFYVFFYKSNEEKPDYIKEPKLIKVEETNFMLGDNKPIKPVLAEANLDNITYSQELLGYIENGRNNQNFGKYPPCFDTNNESIQIFDILESEKLVSVHKVLLEAMSIILCHQKQNKINQCIQNQINDKINDLGNLGFKRNDMTYSTNIEQILGDKYQQTSPFVIELLLRATTLIENEINKMKLSTEKMDKIRKLVNLFYQKEYINISC